MISHEHRAIFVHIQKSAGSSISLAFGKGNVPEKHFTAIQLRELYGQDAWNGYFKFSFVRNPWERLVSWWSMIDKHRPRFEAGASLNKFQSFVLENATTFDEFLENCDRDIVDGDGSKWIYRNQIEYLTDADGNLLVDFIGRFERLEQDFDIVSRQVAGSSMKLPYINRSQHRHYADYYSPETARKVARRFEKDIEQFGYMFGS